MKYDVCVFWGCGLDRFYYKNEEGNLELIDKLTYITANKKECETIFGTDDIEICGSLHKKLDEKKYLFNKILNN